jgi:hypothetical protein
MPPVSDEQVRQAKSVDLLAYLKTHYPNSLRKSRGNREEYYLAEHDSLKISNGKFHWFSQGIGGYSALDFLVKVQGMGFTDAVRHLAGDGVPYYTPLPKPKPALLRSFALPPKNANNDRVYAYLRGRGIDKDIIKRCIDGGTLYENTRHNCIFVGFDGNKPRFACERGTTDEVKKDIFGSDKRYSFVFPPLNPDSRSLMVTESPVDAISHACIYKMDVDRWDGYRLSIGGVGSAALVSFLERHPTITDIRLCLDSDKPGREATARIIRELLNDSRYSRLKITDAPPAAGCKDYNDTLQAIIQLNKTKSHADRSKEAGFLL